jgi:quercetin dioxygenase-like cupin family protein
MPGKSMHVSPSEFHVARRDAVTIRYTLLGDIAYALADLPPSGTRGTFVEDWCAEPHWAIALSGDLELELDGERHVIGPGTAFHVPFAVRHRFRSAGPARLAGFARIAPGMPPVESLLSAAGFELLGGDAAGTAPAVGPVTVHRMKPERPPATGEIVATSRRMGDLLFTRVRLGPKSGYTSEPCDVPHWGLVTAGSLAIDTEPAAEVVTSGEVFYVPPGPPGHRLQAADPAVIVDLSPIEAIERSERIADWRRRAAEQALAEPSVPSRLEVAALG